MKIFRKVRSAVRKAVRGNGVRAVAVASVVVGAGTAINAHAAGVDVLSGVVDFSTLGPDIVVSMGAVMTGALVVWGFKYAVVGVKWVLSKVFGR